MTTLIIPPLDEEPWPSLGPAVCDWLEANLVFGPGDLLGKPYRVDEEARALIERMYQVAPPNAVRPGRRRFDTVVLMLRKGSRKSELAGALAAVELAPDGPVRCDGFRGRQPIGRPVTDPYIPMLAFAEKQAEDTSYAALYQMLTRGSGDWFDPGIERIMRKTGDGKAEALSNAPDSRDGARTTFQVKEETHRWVLPRQREAHQTTRANLAKRPLSEPWELHVTTAYAPGEGSVAEGMHEAARKLNGSAARESRMFFLYRWADAKFKIRNEDSSFDVAALRAAIADASGPVVAAWSDPDRIVEEFIGPESDPEYAERVWLDRLVRRTEMAFDTERWKRLAGLPLDTGLRDLRYQIPKGALVAGCFDGSRRDDHTGLVLTEVATGFQQKFGYWRPEDYNGEIPGELVDVRIDQMFSDYDVWRLYADPPYWTSELAAWAARYGEERVVAFHTYQGRRMGFTMRAYAEAILTGGLSHDGDPDFAANIGNAHKRLLNERDDKGARLWTIQKERDHSPLKIDLAVAGGIAWQARTDAIAAGATATQTESVYETESLLML